MELMRSREANVYGLVPYWAVQRREAESLIEGQDRSEEYAARFGGWFEDDRPEEFFPEPEPEPVPAPRSEPVFFAIKASAGRRLPESTIPLLR